MSSAKQLVKLYSRIWQKKTVEVNLCLEEKTDRLEEVVAAT